jgi:hypothetical protein
MGSREIDIQSILNWNDGIPHPDWDVVESWVERHVDSASARDVWNSAIEQWLNELGRSLGKKFAVHESSRIFFLTDASPKAASLILDRAELFRRELLVRLDGLANFDFPGKIVLIAARWKEDYLRYVSSLGFAGDHESSAGMQIRDGYQRIAMHGDSGENLDSTTAHEMTHLALHGRSMPQWIEEGLAQMIEHDLSGRNELIVDGKMANRHKRYWREFGIDPFWYGEGFSTAGQIQTLSYELAEILMRILFEDHRPRWFGWDSSRVKKLIQFLNEARVEDCGEAASRTHLQKGLQEIAGVFLGPGPWGLGMGPT